MSLIKPKQWNTAQAIPAPTLAATYPDHLSVGGKTFVIHQVDDSPELIQDIQTKVTNGDYEKFKGPFGRWTWTPPGFDQAAVEAHATTIPLDPTLRSVAFKMPDGAIWVRMDGATNYAWFRSK